MKKGTRVRPQSAVDKGFEKATRYVLDKIRVLTQGSEKESVDQSDLLNFSLPDLDVAISSSVERAVLSELEKRGVIAIKVTSFDEENLKHMRMIGPSSGIVENPIPPMVTIKVNKKRFDKVYSEYLAKQMAYSSSSPLTFYLTHTGELYRVFGDGTKQSYQLEKNKLKHRLIEALGERKRTPVTADALAESLDSKAKTIRSTINAIRNEIAERFEGLDGKTFIPDAPRGLGYALGPQVKIISK